MVPSYAINYLSHAWSANTIPFCQGFLRPFAAFIKTSNLQNISFAKLCKMTFGAVVSATFIEHVLNVIFGGTKKQMLWSNASRIVALVENIKTFIKWTVMQFVTKTMGFGSAPIFSSAPAYLPVATSVFGSDPKPAFTKWNYCYTVPETIFNSFQTFDFRQVYFFTCDQLKGKCKKPERNQ